MITKNIIIIGAGFSGLCQAIKLKEAGIHDFLILEKADSVGGTWRENTYPAAACDIPSVVYCYSFEENLNWKHNWSFQDQILEYIHTCVEKYDLKKHLIFKTKVEKATFQSDHSWIIETSNQPYKCKDLIAAIGQLHHPNIPKFKNLDLYEGTTWHSAQWKHDFDLKNKKILVIGNAASAVQFIPEIAKDCQHLSILQRSANWIFPKKENANFLYRCIEKLPFYNSLHRYSVLFQMALMYRIIAANRLARKLATSYSLWHMKRQVKDKKLRTKLIPNYPIGAKRILFSHNYYPALERSNVHLETNPIQAFTPAGIRLQNGKNIAADAVIFATGFSTNPFFKHIQIIGSNGKSLAETWEKGAEAYLGITVAGFPNFYMLYGPNTNLGHASITAMMEIQAKYIVKCLQEKYANNWTSIEVKSTVYAAYNQEIQARLRKSTWNEVANSWYKISGKITNNWVGTVGEYASRTKVIDFEKAYDCK